jgi:hypothetical protein
VFRMIRLAGPTAREAEEQVAKYIEEQVALYDQRDLGTRAHLEQPYRASGGPPTRRGRRRFANHGQPGPNMIGVAACRPTWTTPPGGRPLTGVPPKSARHLYDHLAGLGSRPSRSRLRGYRPDRRRRPEECSRTILVATSSTVTFSVVAACARLCSRSTAVSAERPWRSISTPVACSTVFRSG